MNPPINPAAIYEAILSARHGRDMQGQELAQRGEIAQMGVLSQLMARKQAQEQFAQTHGRLEREQQAMGQLRLAQLQAQTQGRQDMMGAARERQAAQIQAQKDARANTPRSLQLTEDSAGNRLIVNPDGTTRPLTAGGQPVRSPKVDKPLNEFQGKSVMFGTRAAQSDKILKTIEDDISTAGLATKQAVSRTPGIGGALGAIGNVFLSTNQQKVEQAQRDFVNAVLRQESGAVIADTEFENAQKQYFPQPGDDKATRDQKRANRALVIQGFTRLAGSGGEDITSIKDAPLMPGEPRRRSSDSPPPVNAKGWRLMTDKNGNRAYVGPNREVEEVR